jgi:CHAT domain-containing protein
MRAEARLAAADSIGAESDLDRAATLAEHETAGADAGSRFTLLEAAMPAFDELIAIRVARGDTLGALRDLERSRGSSSVADLSRRLAPDLAVVEWASLSDRLLTWIVTTDGIRFHETGITAARLSSQIDRFENLLRQGEDTAAIVQMADDLHELLIAPLASALTGREEVVLVADKSLHRLPFAALRNPRTGHWLVEDHTLRLVPSAGLVTGSAAGPEGPDGSTRPAPSGEGVFLVGDPAFDPADFPELRRLPYAAREVAEVGSNYADADVVEGTDATRNAVIEGMRGKRIVHFAGHARYRPDNPDLSFLLLAHGHGQDTGMLFGREIRTLDLSGVQLIVLSACETLTTQSTRTGGFGGLAGAFLAAGAAGVIGSLWETGDRPTAALVTAFHRNFSSGLDPARALRVTQLEMIASEDPALRDPGMWGAFRYHGR